MSRAKFEAARELIQHRDYAAARAILETMPNDPRAKEWLAKLVGYERPRANRRRAGVLIGLLVAILIAMLGVGYLYFDNIGKTAAAQEAARYSRELTALQATSGFCHEWEKLLPYRNCMNGTTLPPADSATPQAPARNVMAVKEGSPTPTPSITPTPSATASLTVSPTPTASFTATKAPTLSRLQIRQTATARIALTRVKYRQNLALTAEFLAPTQTEYAYEIAPTLTQKADDRNWTRTMQAMNRSFTATFAAIDLEATQLEQTIDSFQYTSPGYDSGGGSVPTSPPYTGGGGTLCADGTYSSSTGRGTCSHHGGIAR